MLVIVCNSLLMIIMYFHKVYIIYSQPDKNTNTTFKMRLRRHQELSVNVSFDNSSIRSDYGQSLKIPPQQLSFRC